MTAEFDTYTFLLCFSYILFSVSLSRYVLLVVYTVQLLCGPAVSATQLVNNVGGASQYFILEHVHT